MRRLTRSGWRFVALLSVFALVLAACATDDAEVADADDEPPEIDEETDPEPEEDPGDVSFELRVGVLLPFTGGLSFAGPPLSEAIRIAAELINESLEELGLSDDISVVIVAEEDDQTETPASLEAATKLVQVDDADVVIGPLASEGFMAVAESITVPEGVILLCPTCSAPQISDLDDDGLVFRTLPSDALMAAIKAEIIAEEYGTDATVNIAARNDAFGVALKEEFEARWLGLGGTIGESLVYDPEAPSFDTEARRITSGDPDAWLLIEFPEVFARLGPALVRAGDWDPAQTFMNSAMRSQDDLVEIGEQATQGLRGVGPTAVSPVGDDYREVFEERSRDDVDTIGFDLSAFDAVMLTFFASLAAGSSDPLEMREHMQAVSGPPGTEYSFLDLDEAIQAVLAGEDINYEGAWGSIDWDERGDPTAAAVELWEFRDGEISVVDTYVED